MASPAQALARLLHARATALNQNHQNDKSQNAAYNPDQ
jgi:hypothetical protein